ncbi:hypothetical protein KY320_03215, partial [Candidatus Woesearchaeota archaeon]|nr:hypothetical protein [Candidatus Woesearchaeota archaeon]
ARVSFSIANVNFIDYLVNHVDKHSDYCIVFPFEAVVRDALFLWEGNTKGQLVVLGQPAETWILDRAISQKNDFRAVIKDINNLGKRWYEDAKLINRKLRKRWDETAKKVVERGFAERWFKEHAHAEEVSVVYRSLLEVYDMEELVRMSKKQLVNAVENAEKHYQNYLKDAEFYMSRANIGLALAEGVVFIPRAEIVFWECYFKKQGSRPDVVYYDEATPQEGVTGAWKDEKLILGDNELPHTSELQIYEPDSGLAVQRVVRY